MQLLLQGTETAIRFVMVSADDNQTADESATPSVNILKPEATSFTSVDNVVSHIDNGVYQVTLTAEETDTAGFLWLECEATGDAVTRREYQIVGGLQDFITAPFDVSMSESEREEIADTVWRRDFAATATASGKDPKGRYTGLALAMANVGVVDSSGEQITIKEPDGTTTLATWSVVTSDAADLTVSRT